MMSQQVSDSGSIFNCHAALPLHHRLISTGLGVPGDRPANTEGRQKGNQERQRRRQGQAEAKGLTVKDRGSAEGKGDRQGGNLRSIKHHKNEN